MKVHGHHLPGHVPILQVIQRDPSWRSIIFDRVTQRSQKGHSTNCQMFMLLMLLMFIFHRVSKLIAVFCFLTNNLWMGLHQLWPWGISISFTRVEHLQRSYAAVGTSSSTQQLGERKAKFFFFREMGDWIVFLSRWAKDMKSRIGIPASPKMGVASQGTIVQIFSSFVREICVL